MCMTSFHLPLANAPKLVRVSNLAWLPPTVHSNCSEAVYLATRTFAISAVLSLSNIVRFPPVRYCQISPAIAETALYSRFGGHNGGVVEKGRRGSARPEFDSPSQPRRFSRATKKALACSHSRSLQLLCTVGGNQARLDARTEFKILERSLKGGLEAGHAHSCMRCICIKLSGVRS